MVGTRRASPSGLEWATRAAAALAERGVAVWSGGAIGVDQAAHRGALDAGGVTVVCAPGGTERPYPGGTDELWREVERRGAIVSLVPPRDPPPRSGFFARNAVLAAMTEATVLVECPLVSGARNTTTHARRLRKPVLVLAQGFGAPHAATVREEARLGARIVHDLGHLLSALSLDDRGRAEAPDRAEPPALSPPGAKLLAALTSTPTHPDSLCARADLSAIEVAVATLELVVAGIAVDEPGRGLRIS